MCATAGPNTRDLLERFSPAQVVDVAPCWLGGVGSATFSVAACVAVGMQAAQRTAQAALLAQHFVGAERVGVRARLRVTMNVFVGLGSVSAAGALVVGTRSAYLVAMLSTALLVLASALPLRALNGLGRPVTHSALRPQRPHRSPLRDPTYLSVAALNAIMTMQFGLLTVGMPLWITGHTRAPVSTVAALLALNTLVVALFQVRAARRARDVPTSGRAVARAGLLLATACVLYSVAGSVPAIVAAGVLLLAALAHGVGEVLSEAGGWGLAFELADRANPGAYQGVSQTGFAAGTMLAPVVVTTTAIEHGTPGWLFLAALFLIAGTGTLLIARTRSSAPSRPGAATDSGAGSRPGPAAPTASKRR